MGVRELWTVLAPVKQETPLSSLAGKTLAVDLSGWVCQALSIPSPKPHLRQLFVRVFRLYCEGVHLVVVLDGEAIQLKWAAMDARARGMGRGSRQRTTGHRSMLNRLIKECKEMLDILGVPHLQSVGEAEALCALLNSEGYVDGVLTQDGDAFLYGATTVYKDLSITDSTVDCYTASLVESQLGLTRKDLVSLALLIGCDYCPQGVPGVGRAAALKFIAGCKPRDSLDILKEWKGSAEGSECKVQRLSRGVIGFPSEAIIKEFLSPKNKLPSRDGLSWRMPQVLDIQLFFKRQLDWSVEGTCAKARALLTHWVMSRKGHGQEIKEKGGASCSIQPSCIVKERREKKIACFEVKWSAPYGLAGNADDARESDLIEFTTIEKAQMFRKVYPELCEAFELAKLEKQKPKKKSKSKSTKLNCKSVSDSPSKDSQSSLNDSFSSETHKKQESTVTNNYETANSSLEQLTTPELTCATPPCSERMPSLSTHSPLTPTHSIYSSTPSHSILVKVIDSDSDHEPSFFERIEAHKLQPLASTPPSSESSSPPSNTVQGRVKATHSELEIVHSPSPVTSSDEEEELPLFSRLRKNPIKATPSKLAQKQLDAYFPQKKLKTCPTKPLGNAGTRSDPILID